MHLWAKPKTINITSNFCFFLFASPNPNSKFIAYHICDFSTTSQNTMCIHTYSLCWLQNISIFRHWLTLSFVGPCPHRDRDYCIGSNFWKLYLIRKGFTLSKSVSLMKASVFHSFFTRPSKQTMTRWIDDWTNEQQDRWMKWCFTKSFTIYNNSHHLSGMQFWWRWTTTLNVGTLTFLSEAFLSDHIKLKKC